MGKSEDMALFGGHKGWKVSDWTASDDRVRGGMSQSYIEVTPSGTARFHGTLDIDTLGGAGFASQRTTTTSTTWDLSAYDGILIKLGKSDGKRYTFILKDQLLAPDRRTGREQATISYEYDFDVAALTEEMNVFVKWTELVPTYRGKKKNNAKSLDTTSVKRFSVMMRSFFGDQEGDFSLTIKSIKAVSRPEDLEKGVLVEKGDSAPFQKR
ncbi:NADH:ubiquinone oxidoreductase complex I intermediate-associated protein 30 [Amniculicola lignicola CBS 123094]|uniref:NADH:ubiquinone oxidoreductase complex I intermediate-associated protein 30 n=1 Tax=Amniculicola lignicola CBS 123094 TaxID=1392246 RepID=A0A6A5W9Q9_9PLEO|nr:NADH:ubiquinone oxidoreductase complex I intermediate-associated protein 30 [Amniculicola lignicola CBS 123094]